MEGLLTNAAAKIPSCIAEPMFLLHRAHSRTKVIRTAHSIKIVAAVTSHREYSGRSVSVVVMIATKYTNHEKYHEVGDSTKEYLIDGDLIVL